tara:strand:+ start:2642 stop:2869 length:228 start_codon:yes stop_codon:yes gene_type:complete
MKITQIKPKHLTKFQIALQGGHKEALQRYYLDWINNFISIERFAEYYASSEKDANKVIDRGREIHGAQFFKKKVN